MKPKEFVAQLRTAVIEENIGIYRDLFSNTSIERASDPYWKRALTLFSELSPAQREVFFEIIRQATVDTTSNVLGVIDGVNSLEDANATFELTCGSEQLNGDLQSLFLTEEERGAK